jgi:microcompartment protein CcmK/EutM
MFLGRVAGCLWATQKNPALTGHRLLIIQPLTTDLQPAGKQLICTDCTGAGAGEIVYWCRGRESSFPFRPAEVPTDATVVGIVDHVTTGRTAAS